MMFYMFKRLANLIKGMFGLAVSGIEKGNPEALLEAEKENLRTQISEYNQGLAAHAGLCERLMTQVKKAEEAARTLRAKTKAHLKAGNQQSAGQLALRLQETERELGENRKQLEDAEKTYKQLLKAREVSVKAAHNKINGLKNAIDDMKIQKATAELSEMASGMINKIGGSGDTLSRLEEMVEEERSKAAGRARLAKDSIEMSEIDLKEDEEAALADQALADFAAAEGITLSDSQPQQTDQASEDEPPIKSMG